ncbi:MAG: TVP38/TMEM64 family protein [Planctomycetota bacterium]|nr:MAG: TVP38/TMEM64 family protein [Planctomycetota bacterium]
MVREVKRARSSNAKWMVGGLLIAVLFAVALTLPLKQWIADMQGWLDGFGPWGLAIFALIYVAAAMLFVPGVAITLAAGALFGFGWGTAMVSVSSTTAAALAFLIGRYLARSAIERKAAANPRFRAIDRAIGQNGWKVIALLRLVPLIPFSLSNYIYGLTAIRFWPYVLASWVAMLPTTCMYVYFGHVAAAGLSDAGGEGGSMSAGKLALMVVGGVALVLVTLYIARLARRALSEQAGLEPASGSVRDRSRADA